MTTPLDKLAEDVWYRVCELLTLKEIIYTAAIFPKINRIVGKNFWRRYLPENAFPYNSGKIFDWKYEACIRQSYADLFGLTGSNVVEFTTTKTHGSYERLKSIHIPEVISFCAYFSFVSN